MERQFVKSMKRLYVDGKVNTAKVTQLFQDGKITKEEKNYILDIEYVKSVNLEVEPN